MKILIIRLSSIGDIVLTQPVTSVLRQHYPQAQIDFITKPQFEPIVRAFNTIDNVFHWKNDKYQTLKKLKKSKYDLVIDLHKKMNTFIIKKFLSASKTLTCNKRHFYRTLLTRHLINKPNETIVNLNLKTLRKIGISKQNIYPILMPDKSKITKINRLLDESGISENEILIALFPGALHETKRYPIENLDKLINITPPDCKFKYILLGSKSEKNLTEYLGKKHPNLAVDMGGLFSLEELLVVIDRVDIVISNDSGPMHIAAALRKNQIALFGSTHSSLGFAPQNPKAILLELNLNCQPCSLYGLEKCPKKHFHCMKDLKPELILEQLIYLIDKS